jgi:hypothetical protein
MVYGRFTRLFSKIRRFSRDDDGDTDVSFFFEGGAMFEGATAAKMPVKQFVQRDRRADEGERRIRVTRDHVLISRRLAGIAMLITVPVSAYRGVALDVSAGESGGASYRLSLAHCDPELEVVLAETADSGEIAADWKHWASWLDLPRLAARGDGLEPLETDFGGDPAKEAFSRRRNSSVVKRRPRFLSRRKPGVTARAETVFAGEREIICYE